MITSPTPFAFPPPPTEWSARPHGNQARKNPSHLGWSFNTRVVLAELCHEAAAHASASKPRLFFQLRSPTMLTLPPRGGGPKAAIRRAQSPYILPKSLLRNSAGDRVSQSSRPMLTSGSLRLQSASARDRSAVILFSSLGNSARGGLPHSRFRVPRGEFARMIASLV